MSGTHGDLFREIGALVVAAHNGQPIDLTKTSEQLSRDYSKLGISAETVARMIARSMGAVGVSLEMVRPSVASLPIIVPEPPSEVGSDEGAEEVQLAMPPPKKRGSRRGQRQGSARRA